MKSNRRKISVSIAPELVACVDRLSDRRGLSRSALIEELVRYGMPRERSEEFDREIREYYSSLTPSERTEDEAIAAASGRAAAQLDYGDRGIGRP